MAFIVNRAKIFRSLTTNRVSEVEGIEIPFPSTQILGIMPYTPSPKYYRLCQETEVLPFSLTKLL